MSGFEGLIRKYIESKTIKDYDEIEKHVYSLYMFGIISRLVMEEMLKVIRNSLKADEREDRDV